jgi:putative ABC transport system permease protein
LSGGAATSFQSVAGYTAADFGALSEPGLPPEGLAATLASSELFAMLGIEPELGRLPEADAYLPGSERVVLISHELWQRRYRGAQGIVGRVIQLAGPEYLEGADGAYRVVGVLPARVWLFWKRFDLILPLKAGQARMNNPNRGLVERMVARLNEGTSLKTARAQGDSLLARANSAGATLPVSAIAVEPLQDALFVDLRPKLMTLLSIAGVVFLLAAVNVVMAVTVQALQRRRETAICIAIGASGRRVFSEAVRDNAITVIAGALLGAGLAAVLTWVVIEQAPDGWLARVPAQASAFRLDGRVTALLVVATGALTALCGAAAYASVCRLSPWSLIGSAMAGESKRSSLWRSGLVAGEIALCAAVVITATVLGLQLRALGAVDLGVETDRTTAVWLNLSASKYPDQSSRTTYYARLLEEIGRLSGVEAMGGVDLPFHQGWQTARVRRDLPEAIAESALSRAATPGYLVAGGLDVVDGRWIEDSDREGSRAVAVVSETLARALWPGQRAVGQLVHVDSGTPSRGPVVLTVVGVVSDTRRAPHLLPDRTLFRPVSQAAPPWLYLVVRSAKSPPDLITAIGTAVWRIDPDQVIDGPWPMSDWVDDRTADIRFVVLLTTILAGLCALLAAAGLYGLTAFWVVQSAPDLGVRRAIGAGDRQILAWFTRQWAAVVVPGLICGLLLQAVANRIVVAGIEGLQPPSWPQIAIGLALIGACSVGAAVAPLLRALNTDAVSLMRRT